MKVELRDVAAGAAAGVFVAPKTKPELAGVDVFVVATLPNAETNSLGEIRRRRSIGLLTCRRRRAAKGERTRAAEHFLRTVSIEERSK